MPSWSNPSELPSSARVFCLCGVVVTWASQLHTPADNEQTIHRVTQIVLATELFKPLEVAQLSIEPTSHQAAASR